MQEPNQVFTDEVGREFHYMFFDNGCSRVAVHFSAFFGDWGDSPKFRATFGGYFHRMKMLSSDTSRDWLFVCDAYGADKNGTYYIGKHSDRFVDRAIDAILDEVGVGSKYAPENTVMIGSSMGATAALRYGIQRNSRGIIAISPHIDLDISAKFQGRERHVDWVLDGGDTQSADNFPTTREIRHLVTNAIETEGVLPHLFLQSCRDDAGVHFEQVLPLVRSWKRVGSVFLDERRWGGHTSEYATRAVLLDVISRLEAGDAPTIRKYKWSREFRPYGLSQGAALRMKSLVGLLVRKIRR